MKEQLSFNARRRALDYARQAMAAGQHEAAERIYREILEGDPDCVEGIVMLSAAVSGRGDLEEAESLLRRAMRIEPGLALIPNNLGGVLQDQGRMEEALNCYQKALVLDGRFALAHCNLGKTLARLGRMPEAIASLRRAVKLEPGNVDALFNLGQVYFSENRFEEAIPAYRRVIASQPSHGAAHVGLGLCLHHLARYEEALECGRKAAEVNPRDPAAPFNMGRALEQLKKTDQAIGCYMRAVELQPDFSAAMHELTSALLTTGRFKDAIVYLDRLLESEPENPVVLINLAHAFKGLEDYDEAVAHFHKALEIKPDFGPAYDGLGDMFLRLGRVGEAIDCRRGALESTSDHEGALLAAQSLVMNLLYHTDSSPEGILTEHRRLDERFGQPCFREGQGQVHGNRVDPARRLRIGYVSGDFNNHVVSYFIEPVIEHHDRGQVEVFCYYVGEIKDAVTDRFAARADQFVFCAGLSDERLSERIRADRIDILVDLSGHTSDRIFVFARKPAPVQVSYLGYPATTGLSAMDYRLTHSDVDPDGYEGHCSETLVRLPETLWCYRPKAGLPEVTELPALRRGYVTFASLNFYAKVSAPALALWARVLNAVPGSRLMMTSVPRGSATETLHARFAEHGIGAERLLINNKLPDDEFSALFAGIDIALDPFPYNGTTTTCDCLWQGVPVVTLTGNSAVSRSGHALLSTVGLGHLAATSPEDYVATAVRLASDLDALAGLRRELRARMQSSPLRDEVRFTRHLEGVYRELWRTWCAKQPR
jgi:predicted O-linked N-acetylglucosamine transferase (SPINDLY family)